MHEQPPLSPHAHGTTAFKGLTRVSGASMKEKEERKGGERKGEGKKEKERKKE